MTSLSVKRWRGLFICCFYNQETMAQDQELLLAEKHLRVVISCIEQQRNAPSHDLESWLRQVDMHLNMAVQLINSLRAEGQMIPKSVHNMTKSSVVHQEVEPTIEPLIAPVHQSNSSVVIQDAHAHEEVSVRKPQTKKEPSSAGTTVSKNNTSGGEVTPTKPRTKQETKQPPSTKQTIADAYIAKAPASTNDNTRVDAVLGERMQSLKSIQKGLTVNDRLRFAAALFGGNRELFVNLVSRLDLAESLPTALSILHENYKGDPSVPELQEFILLLERRFA